MLPQLILAVGALVAAWLLLSWLGRAKPAVAARMVKRGGLILLVGAGLWLVLTGRLAGLIAVAAGAAPWVVRALHLHGLWQVLRRFGAQMGGGRASPGGSSRVEARFVRMELDHDSGQLDGEVVEGRFRGRRLSSLSLAEAGALWREVAADGNRPGWWRPGWTAPGPTGATPRNHPARARPVPNRRGRA